MRKISLLIHTSLDGFIAGPDGEMDWIKVDEEMFDYTAKLTDKADTALFGRKTYQMMEFYWPTAAEQPGATKHDVDHAKWVNKATKIVFSKTLENVTWNNSVIVKENIPAYIKKLKEEPGRDMVMIGSGSIAHLFMENELFDEYWINLNPVLLGKGIPLFKDIKNTANLRLLESKMFNYGVVGLHYEVVK